MNNVKPRTWVKMCGLKRRAEVEAAVTLGVDAIGLVFYPPSSRAVAAEQINDIVCVPRKETLVVGLFVNPTRLEVEEVLASGKVDVLQFHGDESPEFCRSFSVPYFKALGVSAEESQHALEQRFSDFADAQCLLLDAFDPAQRGGTGHSFDWSKAAALPRPCKERLVLAGGLSAANVGAAIQTVKPFGVDVSSGIESRKGEKDIELMQRFYEGVLSA